jgi:hypothetical protein
MGEPVTNAPASIARPIAIQPYASLLCAACIALQIVSYMVLILVVVESYRIRKKSGDTDPANGVILREAPRKALRPAGKPGADRRISTLGAPSRRLRLALV